MLPFFWYLLKVIICSGILFGYYWFFLRNKIFHQYNRFYLLATMSLSLVFPLLKINFWQPASQHNQAIRVLRAVSDGDEYMTNIVITAHKNNWSPEQLYSLAYLIVSAVFLFIMLRTIYLIRSLLKRYPVQQVEEVAFVNTSDDSTPFSFLKYIFWNNSIDINTNTGRQIFNHEVAHIQEKHTYDKLFVNITLIFCWCNPFFWFYRKELNMIHEFIADKKAVEDSDTSAFAAMILQAAYPKHRFELTNNFFYSPIKRRLLMLTKIDNPKISYVARLMVLPLAVLIFAAFTFKVKNNDHVYHGKKITVVIDAGHGGQDLGASSLDKEIFEKELTLDIAKKVKEINSNEAIEIILSRSDDKYMTPIQKVDFAKANNADLVISFHVDGTPKPTQRSGISFWVSKDQYPNSGSSKVLASALINEFNGNYLLPVISPVNQREGGVWILQANTCPAVLIEAGFITNDKDVAYLKTTSAKKTIAKNVLLAIEKFANVGIGQNSLNAKILINDTIPSGMFINTKYADTNYFKTEEFKSKALVIVDSKEIGNVGNDFVEKSTEKYSTYVVYNPIEAEKIYGNKGKYGVIKLTQKDITFITANSISYDEKSGSIRLSGPGSTVKGDLSNSLIYLEHKIISPEELNKIPPEKISSISILKGDKINDIVDAKGKTSVIYVSLKPDDLPEVVVKSSVNDRNSIEPKIYIGNSSGGKIDLGYLKLQKEISISTGFAFNNAVIYFQGPGFKNVVMVTLTSKSLSGIEAYVNRCSDGTQIIFDNVQVKDKNGVLHVIKSPPSFLVVGKNSELIKELKAEDAEKVFIGRKMQEQDLQKQMLMLEQQTIDANAARVVTGQKIQEEDLQKQKLILEQQIIDANAARVVTGQKMQEEDLQKQKLLLEKQTTDANAARVVTGQKIQELDLQKQKLQLEQQAQQGNKVFTKMEVSPQFTGGDEAWRKYLVANLKSTTPVDEGWKAGKYTVVVKFIVHTDGTVSDVTTENYKGSKTAQHCIEVIKNAPRWQPAVQNGRKVNAYKKQPVTFVIEDDEKNIPEAMIYRVPLKVHFTNAGKITTHTFLGNGAFAIRPGVLYYLNGKITDNPENILKSSVVAMESYDEPSGKKYFGEKGKYGVLLLKTKG